MNGLAFLHSWENTRSTVFIINKGTVTVTTLTVRLRYHSVIDQVPLYR